MMKLCVTIICLFLIGCIPTGCVSINYGEASYVRWGNQKVENVKISTPDGISVEIGSANADNNAVMLKALDMLDKRVPVPTP